MSGGHAKENMTGRALLCIENGSFAYRGGPQILKDISVGLHPGEILAVLGPNGAGKTTLLRCMMDMLHWDSGRSLLDGEDIRSMPASKLWRRMAYVPQARSAATSYTAFQTVLLGRSSRIGAFSAPGREDMEIAERVMKRLGIESLADKPCHAISGGELQMVLIARAMAAEPEVLVLDEPESNLDFRNQLVVLDAMSALAAEGVACIFNTHYPAHALQRADRSLLLLRNGEHFCGSTHEIVSEDNIRKAFGVNAVIGEIETDASVLRNVMPVSLSEGGESQEGSGPGDAAAEEGKPGGDRSGRGNERRIASVTIITSANDDADRINRLLGEYRDLIIGRMGQPYRKYGMYIINVNLDGSFAETEELTHRLSIIPGISVKTTYAQAGMDSRSK